MNPTIAILEQAKRDISLALISLKKDRNLDAACSLQDADVALQVVRDQLREARRLKPDPRTPPVVYPPLKLIRGGKR
jgi:hypothetical protein